ncbi:glutathione S-transferase [Motiliproteus coralliicola]|uniref:Glutathione S-transferase n=1 Tax=Motiliproteus coralliicola TaxID=2283196 RepID=A0A369WLX6_9GAMM|nr:glutathione S-transferase N-terminal domain-containing protein [Motiliproteus coralliicola]RDE22677.1 glutathione S-transferase [Motiliproteus coralliicola]
MQLLLNKTSPYARMARIAMLEKGLQNQIELCWCDPWNDDPQLLQHNPVGRIPALVTDQGVTLSESLLIATYLDSLVAHNPLVPEDQKALVLHFAGLGQGLMDASFNAVIARKYLDEAANNSVLSERRWNAIDRTLAQLEHSVEQLAATPSISLGEICVAVAIDYLLFRLPELDTCSRYPKLAAWHRSRVQRPSFETTAFC